MVSFRPGTASTSSNAISGVGVLLLTLASTRTSMSWAAAASTLRASSAADSLRESEVDCPSIGIPPFMVIPGAPMRRAKSSMSRNTSWPPSRSAGSGWLAARSVRLNDGTKNTSAASSPAVARRSPTMPDHMADVLAHHAGLDLGAALHQAEVDAVESEHGDVAHHVGVGHQRPSEIGAPQLHAHCLRPWLCRVYRGGGRRPVMQRVCLTFRLVSGREDEYRRRHVDGVAGAGGGHQGRGHHQQRGLRRGELGRSAGGTSQRYRRRPRTPRRQRCQRPLVRVLRRCDGQPSRSRPTRCGA